MMNRILPPLGGLIFLCAGLGIAGNGLYEITQATASQDWPTTEATVTHSVIDENYDSDNGGYSYRANVSYQYAVNDIRYTSRRIKFGEVGTGDPSNARYFTDRFPVNQQVRVYYDPSNPGNAVLMPGVHTSTWFKPIFGAIFAAVGIFVLWAIQRSKRLKLLGE